MHFMAIGFTKLSLSLVVTTYRFTSRVMPAKLNFTVPALIRPLLTGQTNSLSTRKMPEQEALVLPSKGQQKQRSLAKIMAMALAQLVTSPLSQAITR